MYIFSDNSEFLWSAFQKTQIMIVYFWELENSQSFEISLYSLFPDFFLELFIRVFFKFQEFLRNFFNMFHKMSKF